MLTKTEKPGKSLIQVQKMKQKTSECIKDYLSLLLSEPLIFKTN